MLLQNIESKEIVEVRQAGPINHGVVDLEIIKGGRRHVQPARSRKVQQVGASAFSKTLLSNLYSGNWEQIQ